ncbi:MAG: hypothetical protein WC375_09020, partial [Methanomassiliicoccales archaeon]
MEMERLKTYRLDEVLPHVVFGEEEIIRLEKQYELPRNSNAIREKYKEIINHNFDGNMVKMDSLRYQLFVRNGVRCVRCGFEGSFFSLERHCHPSDTQNTRYHFNLYGIEEDGETWRMLT